VLISELFYSIQGEGRLTGVPSVFIRAAGCNLRCRWCDTPETSWRPVGTEMPLDDILFAVRSYPTRFVVVTGGEPMIAPEIGELTRRLRAAGCHITIETAGTVFVEVCCDLASVSPKLANSTPDAAEHAAWARRHDDRRVNIDVVQRFIDALDYQLKFVVDVPDDLREIDAILARLRNVRIENVLLMPQGVDPVELAEKGQWVAGLCMERGFRFCPRVHIALYGHTRGT